MRRRHILVLLGALAVLALAAVPAQAGTWMQVSCVNPDGSGAGSQGWSAFARGMAPLGSSSDINCTPAKPLSALLGSFSPAPTGAAEGIQYTPPAGSTLIGGTMGLSLNGGGYGSGATAVAAALEPELADSANNVFKSCAHVFGACSNGTDVFSGPVAIPSDRGGNLYLEAECAGNAGSTCSMSSVPSTNAWASVSVPWTHLLLRNIAAPQASGFSGSALQPGIGGTAHLVLTAVDAGGPGVYTVTAFVDGQPVYSATPNNNGGQCVAVGTDAGSGALMFDSQQPCPPTEVVDLPILTAGLPDGSHELAVAVTDAARNTSTVLDQQISTSNPQRTPVPHGSRSVRAQFVLSWSWAGAVTRLRSIAVHRLPRRATVTLSCRGRHCPRLRPRSAHGRAVAKLLRGLGGRRFRAGDRLRITVTAPGRRPERIQLAIRYGAIPQARLVKR